MYIDRRRDTVAPTFTTKTGWLTSKWSKEYAVNAAKTRLYRYCMSDEKSRFPLIRSQRLFNEMRNFVMVGGMAQYAAAPGSVHDDAVMAWMIANVCVDDERQGVYASPETVAESIRVEPGKYIEPASFLSPDEARVGLRHVSVWGDFEGWAD